MEGVRNFHNDKYTKGESMGAQMAAVPCGKDNDRNSYIVQVGPQKIVQLILGALKKASRGGDMGGR